MTTPRGIPRTWGLDGERLHAALHMPRETRDLLFSIGAVQGMELAGEAGSEVARLRMLGFIRVTRANRHKALAEVTEIGMRALLLRASVPSAGGMRETIL